MVFSSMIFLFLYLPAVLALYAAMPTIRAKNHLLLASSLAFYIWGERQYVFVMIASITLTWLCGLVIDGQPTARARRATLAVGVGLNLLLLFYFKYAGFVLENVVSVTRALRWTAVTPGDIPKIHLPIGISFFTFQAISYLIDLYARKVPCQRNLLTLGMYKSFFPQLIAGPIVRYVDIETQVYHRPFRWEQFASGVERFVWGLAQKALLANPVGALADQVFSAPTAALTSGRAWLGVAAYTLQIFFDFAGYSSMAIGLGRMFGFELKENFDRPYTARSITDFWRRWHISLSSWFRDYVYIPLGGNRGSSARTYLNLLLVFLLCGLWHGASWTFLIWGAYHGVFLMLEKARLLAVLKRTPVAVQRAYMLVVVMIGWVFFRAETGDAALALLRVMAHPFAFSAKVAAERPLLSLYELLTYERMAALVIGSAVACATLPRGLGAPREGWRQALWSGAGPYARAGATLAVFALALAYLSGSTFNPFIYFRF